MESERQEGVERSFPVKIKAEAINQNIDFLSPLLTSREIVWIFSGLLTMNFNHQAIDFNWLRKVLESDAGLVVE